MIALPTTLGPTSKMIAALKGDFRVHVKFGHKYFVALVWHRANERQGKCDIINRKRWPAQAIFAVDIPPETEKSLIGILSNLLTQHYQIVTSTLNSWSDEVWEELKRKAEAVNMTHNQGEN